MPFSQWIVVPIQNMHVFGIVMSGSLVCLQGFFLNYIVGTNRLLPGRGMQVACCYVVLVGAFPQNLSFHPLHLTNLLLIWILAKILGFKRSESAQSKVFDAALIIAISSLFYFPMISVYVLLVMALLIIRPFVWREWVISIIGLGLPYLFVGVYYWWYDELGEIVDSKAINLVTGMTVNLSLAKSFYLIIVVIILAGFVGAIPYLRQLTASTVREAKKLSLILWLIIIELGGIVLSQGLSITYFIMLAIPFSIFLANYFMSIERPWLADVGMTLLLAVVVQNHLVSLRIIPDALSSFVF